MTGGTRRNFDSFPLLFVPKDDEEMQTKPFQRRGGVLFTPIKGRSRFQTPLNSRAGFGMTYF